MKKLLIVFLSLIAIILVAVVAIPIIFKDDIKAVIDEKLTEVVNADIVFDVDDFSLSLFTNFPDLTVEVRNFGVVNRAPFEGKKLLSVESLEVEVNLKSVLIDGDMRLKGIVLNRPQIFVSVSEDSSANYDIVIFSEDTGTTEQVKESSSESEFSFAIDHWAINNADIIYDDLTLPFKLELKNMTHTGSGTFSDVLFDLVTRTTVDTVNVAFDGAEYLSDKKLDIDLILEISDNYSKYTFKENTISINNFSLGFDGFFAMSEEGFDMDLTYLSKDNSFKNLLSLVPGEYLQDFEEVKTAGSLSFGGAVKGKYNEDRTPAFNLNMEVANAMFQYPDLPTAATDINVKTFINNTDGVIHHTAIDVREFHVNLGGNPFDATLKISDLNDVKWDLKAQGLVNLANVTEIIPIEGTTLEGLINLDMSTSGKLSLVKAEKYQKLPTGGHMKIKGLKYTDEAFAYDIAVNQAQVSFDPEKINLSAFDAVIGKSDMQMTGKISNYIGYILGDKQVLSGKVDFSSTLIDLDEFMDEEEKSSGESEKKVVVEDTTSLSVIAIPENIDFVLSSKIETVKVMDMMLTTATGDVILREGTANLSNLKFNTLGGHFVVGGSYNAKDIEKPFYDFNLDINHMSISESFKTFSIVQKYVPLAKNMAGNVSTNLNIRGLLKQDMMPDFESTNAKALLKIAEATLNKPKFLADLTRVTKLNNNIDKVSLKDVLMSVVIKDGELSVRPFDINIGNYTANISGKTSVDGKLDYKINMKIPTGALGSRVNSFLSQYTRSGNTSSTIILPISIGGTYDAPVYKVLGGGVKKQASTLVRDVVKNVVKEKINVDLGAEKEKQRQKILAEAQRQANNLTAEAKRAAARLREEGYGQADKLIEEAGSNFFKKAIAQEAAKKLKATTDKKVQKLEDEAKKKADVLLSKAKEKAAAI